MKGENGRQMLKGIEMAVKIKIGIGKSVQNRRGTVLVS